MARSNDQTPAEAEGEVGFDTSPAHTIRTRYCQSSQSSRPSGDTELTTGRKRQKAPKLGTPRSSGGGNGGQHYIGSTFNYTSTCRTSQAGLWMGQCQQRTVKMRSAQSGGLSRRQFCPKNVFDFKSLINSKIIVSLIIRYGNIWCHLSCMPKQRCTFSSTTVRRLASTSASTCRVSCMLKLPVPPAANNFSLAHCLQWV